MSIRAYKIIKVEKEMDPTFNLWHCNPDLLYLLNISEQLNEGGAGYIYISKEEVEEALKQIEEGEIKDEDALKEDLEAILNDIGEGEGVEYSCF